MSINWGDLRRREPVSRVFGLDRGTPIDRYYIEGFLERHKTLIHGRVLEVGDSTYTNRFGETRITQADILHTPPGGKSATIVGDLTTGAGIPSGAFNCLILTQVLPFLFDVQAAVTQAHAALKPGGVVLATVPGISQISRYDMDRWGDFWRFTSKSAQLLFERAFLPSGGSVQVASFGNALAATGFIQGVALEELTWEELDYQDPDYEVTITICARRGE